MFEPSPIYKDRIMPVTKTYTEADQMKLLGIALNEPGMVEQYYHKLRGIIIDSMSNNPVKGLYLDLNSLPDEPFPFKTIFIKWLISVNLDRIKKGEEIVTDISVVLKCPIWKVIKAPIKSISMNKESLFNKPTVTTLGKKTRPGSINKKK